VLPDENAYLHYPNLHLKFSNLDTLYKEAPDIVSFNTSDLGYIESSSTRNFDPRTNPQTYAISLGGSTTESAVIQEDRRWSDLLVIPTLNYGKSKVFSVQSYFNLTYILEVLRLRPQHLLIMHGINDIWTYIGDGAQEFEPKTYQYIVGNPWTDFVVKHLYLPTFLWRLSKEYNYYAFYRYEARRSLSFPPMSKSAFQHFLRIFEETLKPKLHNLYRNLLFDIAHQQHFPLVDVANCFAHVNVGDLIYDSVHLTEKGSRYFADCVNGPLQSEINIRRAQKIDR